MQDWSRVIEEGVQFLFGEEARALFREHTLLFLLPLLGAGLALAGWCLSRMGRALARGWQESSRGLTLLWSVPGRRLLGLTRQIREGEKRLLRVLPAATGDRRESQDIAGLLGRFIHKELPESLDQAQIFIASGGAGRARMLRRSLDIQQRKWSETEEGPHREQLTREIASLRHRLAQTEQANAHLATLLEGLEEAVLALRSLEIELASLGATRSQSMEEIQDRLSSVAEGLRHRREAHLSFREPS